MDIGEEIFSAVFKLIIFIPLLGIMCSSAKSLHNSIIHWKHIRNNKQKIKSLIFKIIGVLLIFGYGLFVFLLLLRKYLFPELQIPFVLQIISFILIIPYLGLVHMVLGLTSAITFSKYSTSRMLNEIFNEKDKNKESD